MACGACGRGKKTPTSQNPGKSCPRCKYPARLVHQYNIKMHKQESVWICQNPSCKNVIR